MSKKRVLIVEDDEDLADLLRGALSSDYDVDVAYDGQQGLDKTSRAKFDVLVVDLVMPVLDGEDMLDQMRANGLQTPVIISSGTPHLAAAAARLGAAAVLAKPYEVEDLEDAIERATSGTRSPAAPPPPP